LLTRSIGDILDENFAGDALKGMLSFDAITGNFQSLYTPGNGYVLLHHVVGCTFGENGRWGHSIGGMGSITAAMAKACENAGVTIHKDHTVTEVLVDKKTKECSGVLAKDTKTSKEVQFDANVIASNVHPQILALSLLKEDVFQKEDEAFVNGIKRYQSGSGTLRMNVALSELPDFICKRGAPNDLHLHSSIMIAPSIAYIEQAFQDALRQGYPNSPVIEMMVPSVFDSTLCPPGKHVANLFCQHFDPSLEEKWNDLRETAAERVIDTLTEYAPNFKSSILGKLVLTPWDLQQRFGLIGGDIFHGKLTLSQILAARPVFGYSRYATPIKGLYLCGSGAHPGGGVTGIPGMLSAKEILHSLGISAKD